MHAEARPAKKRKLEQAQRQAVVLDIEGTVLPISFVKETLFPYAAQHMQAFLAENVDRPEVHASLRKLHSAVRLADMLSFVPGPFSLVSVPCDLSCLQASPASMSHGARQPWLIALMLSRREFAI